MILISLLIASFYVGGGAAGGDWTASGKRYDKHAFTAALPSLAFGTLLHVCRGRHCVTVVVDDRGPFVSGRQLDLSLAGAKALRITHIGVAKVRVSVPLPRPRPLDANCNLVGAASNARPSRLMQECLPLTIGRNE
jgi:rare lipoprotein A